MYELFFQKFRERVPLTAGEQEKIAAFLTLKKLRKKQYLLQAGDVCKAIAFVEKGTLREYAVDKGNEHIIQFAIEGWTISDLFSFLTGEPATYNIDALEEAELVLITREAHEELLKTAPKYETYVRLLITGAYLALQRRHSSTISSSIEERYLGFIARYPDLVQRVPQHMIASYLGLTPETLSRVRKKILSRK
jgi:CRP-like cAMP-binding protein